MPRPLRAEIFDPKQVTIVHCIQRCVRRTFLAGVDPDRNRDFTYRRDWIRSRIEKLASVFGMDGIAYAILSNHLHVILRSRPDVVATWTDREVAIRWLQIFPGKRIEEQLGAPTEADVNKLVNDANRIAQLRVRLSDYSWFMRALSEPIARRANREENCTGHFWEGRYKATRLLDEASLFACCLYVDLNPLRANAASSLELSEFTSFYDRIEAAKGKKIASAAASMNVLSQAEAEKILAESSPAQLAARRKEAKNRKGPQVACDAWLAPLSLDERSDVGPMVSRSGLRASDKGCLSVTFEKYRELLEWTARNGKPETRQPVPTHLTSIVEGLGIEPSMWCDLVWNFKRYFGRNGFAGTTESLKIQLAARSKTRVPCQRRVEACFV